ncbi:MAG: glycosyltransferase family protein [Gammaproteobacteria bacterium]
MTGVHVLEPILEGRAGAFLACSVDRELQRAWAIENGLPAKTDPDDVLLAQIEHARAEVFYTQSPHKYGPAFLHRLPGCVRRRICWASPPAPVGDLTAYDLVLNNFPCSLEKYGEQGVRTGYFTPSFDPAMADYCDNQDRPIDIAFVGSYTRHTRARAVIFETIAELHKELNMHFSFNCGRLTRLAESPIGWMLPVRNHARPPAVRAGSYPALFGRQMYALLSSAKIVLNGAVDLARGDRGNIRCFEAMGCGALLLTDQGRYPDGMENGRTMRVYDSAGDAVRILRESLGSTSDRERIAASGLALMKERYSKGEQWRKFQELVS